MSNSPADQLEAVFLFKDDQVARELLYPEFEAILDGFIPVPDFISASAKAVYVQINNELRIVGAVFFLLGFDAKGMVDRRWNVPLQQLLASASLGPDLGAGPIRLACYSQCPVEWHQKNLWDPQMRPGNNSFSLMLKALKANRLGLVAKVAPKDTPVDADAGVVRSAIETEREQLALQQKFREHYAKEMRDKMAMLVKEQRLSMATLVHQNETKIHAIQHEHQQRLLAYQEKLRELEKAKKELEERNRHLKENFDVQANKIEGMREYFAHKIKAVQQDENNQLQELEQNFALELDVKIQAATAEMREMLDMREVELFYRHQNESALKEEIVNLKRENQALMKNGSDQLLGRLAKAGVNFVSFQPGVGQFNIPVDDLSLYLDNPQSYAAEKSGVDESLYLAWLEHHHSPRCNALDHHGQVCGKPVTSVESPLEFHRGESDRCEHHQAVSYPRLAERR